MQTEQSSHGEQGESVTQLQADPAELGRQNDQQGEALRTVRHPGGDQPDRLHIDEPGQPEGQGTCVLAAVGVEVEEPAAADDVEVHGQADARGRSGARLYVDRPEVALAVGRQSERDLDPQALDDTHDRPERGFEVRGEGEGERAALDAHQQGERGEVDRAEADVGGEAHLQAAAALEPQAVGRAEPDAELEAALDPDATEQLRDEAVTAGQGDEDLAALQQRPQLHLKTSVRLGSQPQGHVHLLDRDPASAGKRQQDHRIGGITAIAVNHLGRSRHGRAGWRLDPGSAGLEHQFRPRWDVGVETQSEGPGLTTALDRSHTQSLRHFHREARRVEVGPRDERGEDQVQGGWCGCTVEE